MEEKVYVNPTPEEWEEIKKIVEERCQEEEDEE